MSAISANIVKKPDANRAGRADNIQVVLHDGKDSVAVAVVEGIKSGDKLNGLVLHEDKVVTLTARQDIPVGHKVAIRDMNAGDAVFKHGQEIGKAAVKIAAGEHAHAHNVRSNRR